MKSLLYILLFTFFYTDTYSQTDLPITYRTEDFLGRVNQEHAEIFRSYQIENGENIVRDFYLNGKLRGNAKQKNGLTHGLYIGYYKNGVLRDSGHYYKGLRWGSWKVFHQNGKVKCTLNFKDDFIHGIVQWYDSLGNLITKQELKKGEFKSWISFYANTQNVREEINYEDGKRHGEFKTYFPDGRLKRSGIYKTGKYIEGSGKLYNIEGAEIPYTPAYKPISFNGNLRNYILSNMHYPKNSLENNIQGIVYTRVEIDEKGNVIDAAIAKGINEECNDEALRIIKSLKFNPPVYDEKAFPSVQRINVPFYVTEFLKRQYLDKEKATQEVMQEIENNSNPFK